MIANYACYGSGANGRSISATAGDKTKSSITQTMSDTTTNGTDGITCRVVIGYKHNNIDYFKTSYSVGGLGGLRYIQNQSLIDAYHDYVNDCGDLDIHITVVSSLLVEAYSHQSSGFDTHGGEYNLYHNVSDTTSAITHELMFSENNETLCKALSTYDYTDDANGADGYTKLASISTSEQYKYYGGTKNKGET